MASSASPVLAARCRACACSRSRAPRRAALKAALREQLKDFQLPECRADGERGAALRNLPVAVRGICCRRTATGKFLKAALRGSKDFQLP